MAAACESNSEKISRLQKLIKCAEKGSLQEFLSHIVEDADYYTISECDTTLLHYAAVNKTTSEIISHLIAKGIPVDVKGAYGRTPLHVCALRGNLLNMKVLVEAGADIYATDHGEKTAVHLVALNDHGVDIVESSHDSKNPSDGMLEYLISRGLKIDAYDEKGMTPLLICAARGTLSNLQLLIAKGANVRSKDDHGRSALHIAVTNEKGTDIIQYLLEKGINVNTRTCLNRTPLHECARGGYVSNMQVLVKNGADPRTRDCIAETALHYATKNKKGKEMVDYLVRINDFIDQTADDEALNLALKNSSCAIDEYLHGSRLQQIIKCAEEGSLEDFLSLIEDADYYTMSKCDTTLLHHAAVNKTTSEIISHLIAKGIPIDKRRKDGRTPLHECALRGNLPNIKVLVEAGANIHYTDYEEKTAVHFVAKNSSNGMLEYLIGRGLAINVEDKNGATPLFYCLSWGTLANVQLLIAEGADIKVKVLGLTALHVAVTNEEGTQIIQYLLENGLDVNERSDYGTTPLHVCAECGNVSNMQLLLKNGANLSARDRNGRPALHLAAINEKGAAMVDYLIGIRVHIDLVTGNGETALHLASENPACACIVEYLLKKGASADARTKNGQTALHYCAAKGDITIMKLLLENKADITARDNKGRTALHAVVINERGPELVYYLIASGIGVDSIDNNGITPLHLCVISSNPARIQVAKALLTKGASPSVRANNGRSALHICFSKVDINMMKLLPENGANLRDLDENGLTALHIAARCDGVAAMIHFLINKGLGVNLRATDGLTPLHCCAMSATGTETFDALVKAGADIRAVDNNGLSVLHHAAKNERGKCIIRYLLNLRMPIDVRANSGMTPLHVACEAGILKNVKVLLEKRANPTVKDYQGRGVYEYRGDLGHFYGPFGEEQRTIIERHMKNTLMNITVQVQSDRGIGVYDEELQSYNGCVGQLQSNESDIIMMMYEYPMKGENITQGMLAYDTSLTIAGSYEKVETGTVAQIVDSFDSFSPDIWGLCVIFWLSLSIILKISQNVSTNGDKMRSYSFYHVAVHCLRIGEIPVLDVTSRISFIFASIFSLVVVHYFCSFIKTQLVVMKDPDLFLSYQDIIDAKAVPYFIKGMSYGEHFSKKDALSFRRNLWSHAVNEVTDAEDLSIQLNPLSFLLIILKLLTRKAVIIMDTALMPLIPGTICPISNFNRRKIDATFIKLLSNVDNLKKLLPSLDMTEDEQNYIVQFLTKNHIHFNKIPEIYVHIARDPEEKMYPRGILQSAFTDEKMKQSLHLLLRRGMEYGFNLRALSELKGLNLLRHYPLIPVLFGRRDKSRNHLVEECMSENFVKSEVQSHALTHENLKSLFVVIIVMLILCFYVLIYEQRLAKKECGMNRDKQKNVGTRQR